MLKSHKSVTATALASVMLFVFAVSIVKGEENFIVTYGQDKVFTEFNNSSANVFNPYSCSVQKEAYAAGSTTYLFLSGLPGGPPVCDVSASGNMGVYFAWDFRGDGGCDLPIRVTIDLSYQISAYWGGETNKGDPGLSMAWVGRIPYIKECPTYPCEEPYDYIDSTTGPGSRVDRIVKTYQTTPWLIGLTCDRGTVNVASRCLIHGGNAETVSPNCSATVTINSIKIEFLKKPPVASFTYSPETPRVDEEITFDASSSSDPDGTIVKYAWNFGDGSQEESKAAVTTHKYSRPGTYTCTLTVTDNDGLTNSLAKSIEIKIPEVSISYLDRDDRSREVHGAAADGVSEVIIQIRNLPKNITFPGIFAFIPFGDGYLEDFAISDGVFTQTFRAPEYFVRDGHPEDLSQGSREIGLTITLYGQVVEHPPFFLIKPPIALLHGINDNMLTWWSELCPRLIQDHGYQYISGYSYPSFDPFNTLSWVIKKTIEDALGAARKDGFVAKKADVVAHSMGGLLAKLYGRESNIRSITTVGTPHFGSPWADAICDAVGCESKDQDLTAPQRFIDRVLKTRKIDIRNGAIKDLRVTGGSTCNSKGRNCIVKNVPNYVIVGIVDPQSLLCWGFIDVLFKLFKLTNPLVWANPSTDLYHRFFGEERSDWVVSESSQKGYWAGDTVNVTCHDKEPKDKGVLDKILNYLHRTGSIASTVQADSTKGQETQGPQYTIPPLQMGVSSGLVQITNPFEGQVFQIGDTVSVEISVSNENAMVFIGASTGESALINHSPYNFQFVIPNEVIGPLTIMAGASDGIGFIGSDEVTINVASTAKLSDMKLYPEIDPLSLPLGASVPLAVYGSYDDNVTRDITSSGTGTSYTSSNPAIIEASPEGVLTAKSIGKAIVAVNNSGISKEITVSTAPKNGETIGVFRPSMGGFYLRNSNTAGVADLTFRYGPKNSTWLPIVGDWTGGGTSTVGLYDPVAGTFRLRNSNTPGVADLTFRYGPKNSTWIPVVGDWDGNRTTTVGLYDPVAGLFRLKNSNTPGPGDINFRYGPKNSTWIPIVGDWNGDGITTVGLYDPAASKFYLRDSNTPGVADITISYGIPGGIPLAGDWDGLP